MQSVECVLVALRHGLWLEALSLEVFEALHPVHVQCVEIVLGLISDSLDAWRTRQYDYYQRVLNGIL